MIFGWDSELAQSVAKVLLEEIDEELMKEREEGLSEEGLRDHGVTTPSADANTRRRLCRDGEGKHRLLLDERILSPSGALSPITPVKRYWYISTHSRFRGTERVALET